MFIKNKNTKYWSNEYGWTSFDEATRFSSEESKRLKLPIGGEWIHDWDRFDKTDPAFIAGMNYQRFLLREPEEDDTIYLLHYEDDYDPIETKFLFSNLSELEVWDDGRCVECQIFSIRNIENIEGKFYVGYSDWERIK